MIIFAAAVFFAQWRAYVVLAQLTIPCCLHVVVQLTGRFIIDAGALNKELMLQHPELQFYFSDLSRPLPEASVVATSELFRMIAVGKVQKSS